MSAFAYRGGYRYHLVFGTKDKRPVLRPRWAALAVEELERVAAVTRFTVDAYCVMPTHVHALVAGDAELDSDLHGFAHKFKQSLGYRFKQATGQLLWHRSYYDHVLRSDEPVLPHVAYILANPVVAGLVSSPVDWPYCGPGEALDDAVALKDRSKDLSVQIDALAREFDDHEVRR